MSFIISFTMLSVFTFRGRGAGADRPSTVWVGGGRKGGGGGVGGTLLRFSNSTMAIISPLAREIVIFQEPAPSTNIHMGVTPAGVFVVPLKWPSWHATCVGYLWEIHIYTRRRTECLQCLSKVSLYKPPGRDKTLMKKKIWFYCLFVLNAECMRAIYEKSVRV